MSISSGGAGDDDTYDVWPALTDLLAASAMLFLVLLAVVVFDRVKERGELKTLRAELVSKLLQVPNQKKLFSIEDDPQLVRITLREDVTFPTRKYDLDQLKDEGRSALREIGQILQEPGIAMTYQQVLVVGHADQVPTGSAKFTNWELSVMRAATVARFLVQGAGVDPCRITASGVGSYFPLIAPAGQPDRKENRRIEIMILPALAQQRPIGAACYSAGDGALASKGIP